MQEDTLSFPGERQYRELIDLCSDAIFLAGAGGILHANRAGMDLIGASGSEALRGLTVADLFAGSPEAHGPQARTVKQERLLHRLDGSTLAVEMSAAPCDAGGGVDTAIVVRGTACGMQSDDFRRIADGVPALLASIDASEHYRYVNAACLSWLGRPRQDVIGHALSELHAADYSVMQPHLARALAGHHVRFECMLQGPRGSRQAAVAFAPDLGPDGSVHGVSAIMMDIAERRGSEQAPRQRSAQLQQLQQLRLITDAVPVSIARCDRDYRLRFVNRTHAGRLGMNPEDMMGRLLADIVGEEAFAHSRAYIDAALAGAPQEQEVKIPSQDGSDHSMHIMYVPEFDAQGTVHGVIAAISDITRLRRAEEELHRREQEFKTLVENSPDAISRIDRDMRHIYVNPAIETMTGLPAAEFPGHTNAELGLPDDMVHAWDSAVRAAFDSGAEQRFDYHLKVKGQRRFCCARVMPEADRDGRFDSVLSIMYDMTDRTELENEHKLLLARERGARIQAETAARARDEFLAIVSHELRAPLNGIQSWAHILENYVKDAASGPLAQRAISGIKTGVSQQVRLIEDLLDVTRMMSGKLRLVKQPLMLLSVLQAAVESVRGAAEAKNIVIHCGYGIAGEEIDGDADRVQQILWNLLTNAVKFTPEGGNIWLTAASTGNQVVITLRDDGVGISREFLPFLFDRFSQEDTSSTRGHSGLGLGLFLVRHLVELHGGSVAADSEGDGKGTAFSIRLPLRLQNGSYPPPVQHDAGLGAEPLPSLTGLRILLIDDQEDVRESLAIVLSAAGASISAGSTQEVFDWLATLDADKLPQILVCDIAMPVEDGYTVLRRLRAWSTADGLAPLRKVPALALTAFAQREDRIKALTAGFQMHMTKPVSPEELIVVIAMMAMQG